MDDPFVEMAVDRDRLLVRADLREELSSLLPVFLDGGEVEGAGILPGGRGQTLSVPLRPGLRAVLRRNLRGGLPAKFARDVYVEVSSPRPFAEVRATERLRDAGIEVPEALGAIVRPAGPRVYRGAVATREIGGTRNLWEHLRHGHSTEERRATCASALALVDRMLAAGGVHPDLNLKNFLVSHDGSRLWLIDCDRLHFVDDAGPAYRRRARARLQRSAARLDPAGEVVDPAWFDERA
jgi:hypothetical protein